MGVHDFSDEAARMEQIRNKIGAFLQSNTLCADTGLRNESPKFIQTFFEILFEIGVYFVVFRHGISLSHEVGQPFERIVTCNRKKRHFDDLSDPCKDEEGSHRHFGNTRRDACHIEERIGDRR